MAQEDEHRIEIITAGYVYNFARLAVWPDLPKQHPIKLCISAQPYFFDIFRQFSGKKVAGRALKIVEYSEQIHNDCQILFIDINTPVKIQNECKKLKLSSNVLTISNQPNFSRNCGIIGLFEEDNRLRFEINIDTIKKSNLRLSSYLYKLARILRNKDL